MPIMFRVLQFLLKFLAAGFRSRLSLQLEVAALRLSVLNIGTPRDCWAFLLQLCLASHSFYGNAEERISLCFGAEMAQDPADDAGPAQSRDAAPSLYYGLLPKPQ